jgi:hypothetical protein
MEKKIFLVIGGGGGLNHPTRKKSCGETDLAADYKPMYHYITVSYANGKLLVDSWRVEKDFSGIQKGRSLKISVD